MGGCTEGFRQWEPDHGLRRVKHWGVQCRGHGAVLTGPGWVCGLPQVLWLQVWTGVPRASHMLAVCCSVIVPGRSFCCSVAKLCPTLCNPMDCSMPCFLALHYLPELTQAHVLQVNDAIPPSHPLLSPSPLALNLSQPQSLFSQGRHV